MAGAHNKTVRLVTASSIVRVQSMFSLYRMYSLLRRESYCASGSLTASLLTFEINCIGCPFSRAESTRCMCWSYTTQHQPTSPKCAHQCLSVNRSHLRFATHGDPTIPRYRTEIWTTMFHCFWSHFLEHTAANRG